MTRYKPSDRSQTMIIPVNFQDQLQPKTFEWALDYIIDNHVDVTPFEKKFKNDKTGAPAWNPRVMLKIILFAYSRGIISSRDIAECCENHATFMALSAYSRPHFTTIADFVSGMGDNVKSVFTNVLMYCDELGLIGGELLAIDGCKMPSNASKEWSGTKEELKNKKEKMENTVKFLMNQHKSSDENDNNTGIKQSKEQNEKQIENIKKKIKKIDDFLNNNDDKPGSGKPRKSNINDTEHLAVYCLV